jgi:hypothetical protein
MNTGIRTADYKGRHVAAGALQYYEHACMYVYRFDSLHLSYIELLTDIHEGAPTCMGSIRTKYVHANEAIEI